MLNIAVLLKQTFDTEEKIVVTPDGSISSGEAKLVINPYDEYALEEALRQRELHGGKVYVITSGPEKAEEALRTALAMGADEAVRLESEGSTLLAGGDSHTIAAALAEILRPLAPDLVLAGLFAVDSGSGSVALQVAERLSLPHASAAVKLDIAGAEGAAASGAIPAGAKTAERFAIVERDVEGDTETVAIPLPALVTAQQGLNEPRYPSLPGIMKAKKKPLVRVNPADFGNEWLTAAAARTVRTALFPPEPRAAGKRLPGSPAEQAAALTQLLQTAVKLG
ncbi:electron transfer flavoprotein subunit beta/FixA family protein [Paenibacillus radicis (ex Gao et al. 2016)]|uniref:Electron transfer flavoprotein subunit beta n=1 Tax=Paenibacillus radicis (ex Gao et al. 2016) TaxID=1737354 RepID=A0A917H3Y3_9BACL|nr:electron transfer flavoprotein subunit beta/FixA family protein [Paenibacillus radicis (ex Gao et al. 2016)]GGG65978.1 electron transfer flavoprotein subunit beta [Paenibacillus radicis (ex Gao et al. 2016)]